MRIISGSLKGRKLTAWNKNLPLRPMTDRMKESLFNVLSPYLSENYLFLDLFSGTGSLALESLSRGARKAHVVEKHPECIKLIKKNMQILPDPKQIILHKQNVFSFLKPFYIKSKKIPAFDIIVIDPPFPLEAGQQIMKILQNSAITKKNSIIAIETGKWENLDSDYQDLCLFSKKIFNDKKMWFYEHK